MHGAMIKILFISYSKPKYLVSHILFIYFICLWVLTTLSVIAPYSAE